ncbi:type II toxin-antitoxin system VapC family toxin [Aquipuribacter nitratireducens]|uniref:Type II toxin-antitoxin system VapC family toxin n=1 Tax=Aquipuribacter nitratireducens TaxID=650104 RepID=A0ABW0GHN0_9MICO
MRLLLDTHAFLWLAAGDERLVPSARALIDRADSLVLSAASVWEAEIKRAAGRLGAPPLAEAARRLGVDVLPVTAEHATAAAHLALHHRDPFDRMLVAQARLEDLVLVTKDDALRRYGVPTAW